MPRARRAMSMTAARSSNAPVLTSPACAHTIVGASVSTSGGSARHVHPPLAVGGDHHLLLRPDPEEPERARHRHVALGSDDHPERRRTGEPSRGKIPAGTRVDRVPRRREAGDVRHLAAGDERERRVRGQPEELDHPAARERLERGGRGRRLREPGVLVPRRHEPVGRDRCGQRAADHEAEVPAGAHRGDPGLEGRQLLDHLVASDGPSGHGRVEAAASRGTCARTDAAGVERLEVVGRDLRRAGEELALGHGAESTSGSPDGAPAP